MSSLSVTHLNVMPSHPYSRTDTLSGIVDRDKTKKVYYLPPRSKGRNGMNGINGINGINGSNGMNGFNVLDLFQGIKLGKWFFLVCIGVYCCIVLCGVVVVWFSKQEVLGSNPTRHFLFA